MKANFSLYGAFYAEGLVVTTALRLFSGELLYRDIATVYPPGIFLLVMLAFKSLGTTLLAERMVSLFFQAALAGIVYTTCRRMINPFFSFLAFLVALASIARTSLFGYATTPALVFVFLCFNVIHASLENHSHSRLFGAGLLAGLVSLFRHDFAIYLVTALSLLFILNPLKGASRETRFPRGMIKTFSLFFAGFILAVIPWVGPFIFRGALHDLLVNLFRYTQSAYPKAMFLVFPSFDRAGAIYYVPLFVALLGIPTLFLFLKRRKNLNSADWLFISILLFHLFSLGNFFVHPDRAHLFSPLVLSVPLSFFLLAQGEKTFLKSRALSSVIRVATVFLVLLFLMRPTWERINVLRADKTVDPFFPYTLERLSGIYDTNPDGKALEKAVRFVVQHTHRNERIFVALPRHDNPVVGDLLFYFLSNRLPAVKYQELGERGIAISLEGQEAMVQDLKKRDVRWVVIHTFPDWHIPYRYPIKGATRLDEYLQKTYGPIQEFPPYTILHKKPEG